MVVKNKPQPPPVLEFSEFDVPFIFENTTLRFSVGFVLDQDNEEVKTHQVQYKSHSKLSACPKYSAFVRHFLVDVYTIQTFSVYVLSSRPFKLVIGNIKFNRSSKEPCKRKLYDSWNICKIRVQCEFSARYGPSSNQNPFASGTSMVKSTPNADLADLAATLDSAQFDKSAAVNPSLIYACCCFAPYLSGSESHFLSNTFVLYRAH